LHYDLGVDSASKRDEYQKKIFVGVKRGQHIRLTAPPSTVSQLSRKHGILDISRSHRPPWSVKGIALFDFYFTRHKKQCRCYFAAA
jgi:hypothetical protein